MYLIHGQDKGSVSKYEEILINILLIGQNLQCSLISFKCTFVFLTQYIENHICEQIIENVLSV